MFKNTFILRATVAIILLMHSIPGMFDGGIRAFGTQYLDTVGFAPAGLVLAWAIKLCHVVSALLLLFGRYLMLASLSTIAILLAGIFMIHLQEGWYVVGGGRNGVEFNVLLIATLLYIVATGRKKGQVSANSEDLKHK